MPGSTKALDGSTLGKDYVFSFTTPGPRVASVTPGLCWLWCLVDAQRRALCDLAAGTVLVRMPPTSPPRA